MHFFELVDLPLHIAHLHLQIFKVDLIGDGNVGVPNGPRVDHILRVPSLADPLVRMLQLFVDIAVQLLNNDGL